MPTPATHVWRPSAARLITLDSFVPTPRGTQATALPLLAWPAKDPADILDYQFDITPALTGNRGDVIATLDVAVIPSAPGDLAVVSASADGARAVFWLGAGFAGTTYVVTITIGTHAGRTLARSVLLPVLALATQPVPDRALLTDAGLPLFDQNENPLTLPGQ